MDGFPCRLRAAAILAVGLLATTGAAARAAGTVVPVRLLSPEDGAVLVGGTTATLEWTPAVDLAAPERWDEWEAFLSLDGGKTYPVRVTPHLDRALRRIDFRVPGLPTGNARILLRIGDEHRETAFELPERFTIAVSISSIAGTAWSALDLPRTVRRRGEPARPGEPGVFVWVEGSRYGGAMREVVAEEPARLADAGIEGTAGRPAPAAVTSEEPPSGAPATDLAILSDLHPPPTGSAASPWSTRPATTDILLLIQRQNE
jgi:hypothetical protein